MNVALRQRRRRGVEHNRVAVPVKKDDGNVGHSEELESTMRRKS